MTLQQARLKAEEITQQRIQGRDPKAEKAALKDAQKRQKELSEEEQRTFSKVAALWLESERQGNKWRNDPTENNTPKQTYDYTYCQYWVSGS